MRGRAPDEKRASELHRVQRTRRPAPVSLSVRWGRGPVGAALALLRVTEICVRQIVPGDIGEVALVVHEDPGRLFEPAAAAGAGIESFRSSRPGASVVVSGRAPSSPGRRVQQAAPHAAHPRRKSERGYPSDHRPVPLLRARRLAERPVDAERASNPVHVADLSLQGIVARAVPGADVLHHHQAVRTAHDGSDRAVAQQVRQPDRNVLFRHGASPSSRSACGSRIAVPSPGRPVLDSERPGTLDVPHRVQRRPKPRARLSVGVEQPIGVPLARPRLVAELSALLLAASCFVVPLTGEASEVSRGFAALAVIGSLDATPLELGEHRSDLGRILAEVPRRRVASQIRANVPHGDD